MSSVYFSCPKFTVRLVVSGTIIQKAAPMVKVFEGQTIGALTSWAESNFGGPIMVQKLSEYAAGRSCMCQIASGYSAPSSAKSSRRASYSSATSLPSSSRSAKSMSGST